MQEFKWEKKNNQKHLNLGKYHASYKCLKFLSFLVNTQNRIWIHSLMKIQVIVHFIIIAKYITSSII